MSDAESLYSIREEFNQLVNGALSGAGQQEFADNLTPILYQKDVVVWNAATEALRRYGRAVLVQSAIGGGSRLLSLDTEFYAHSTGLVELSGMTSGAVTPEQETAPIDALRISSLLGVRNPILDSVGFQAKADMPQSVDILKPEAYPAQTLLIQHLTLSSNTSQTTPFHMEMETYGRRPGSRLGRMLAGTPDKHRLMQKSPDIKVHRHEDQTNKPLGDGSFVVLSRPILPSTTAELRTSEDVARAVEDAVAEMEASRTLYEIIGALGRSVVDIKAFKSK